MDEKTRLKPALPLMGRRVVVAGLARSGLAVVRFLISRGCEVVASDRKQEEQLADAAEEARRLGAALDLGGHTEAMFTSADLVVVSPGVPMSLPVLEVARARGVPIIAEVELAARFLRGRILGITGSNGKSTTTALTAAMLTAAGVPARACGNIGTPLIEMVERDTPESVYAVELSSFQLEGIVTLRPAAAVLLNLAPDHLDRYRDYGAYVAAKARIFMNQRAPDVAILNASDADSRLVESAVRAPVRLFSSMGPVEDGAFLRRGEIVLALAGRFETLMPVSEVPLPGAHNLENVMAGALAALNAGVPAGSIRNAVREFLPLPHRLEPVGSVGGVEFYNDSKATNVASTAKALDAFAGRRVFLILGGRDKGGDFASLAPLIGERAAAVLLIGEAASIIERQIAGGVALVHAETLDRAVEEALVRARPGDVVLLAPGCASFDQYRNYEQRGEHFRSLVGSAQGSRTAAAEGMS